MNRSITSCLICGSNSLIKLNGYDAAFLTKCSSCGFVFSYIIPTEEELIEHYKNYDPDNVLSKITIKRYNELLDKFEKYRKTNNLLDIGCGEGFFLETAKKRGWNVFGTEYREDIIHICSAKGISMHHGKLSEKNYPAGHFDIITSFEVIEHINNPKEVAGIIYTLLRTGGLTYLTTPNFNSISRILLGNKWNVIQYPEHLSYYTPKTLNTLFHSLNFTTHSIKTTGISISRFRKSLGSTTTWQDENIREGTESNPIFSLLKRGMNMLLSLSQKGDSIKAFYQKV